MDKISALMDGELDARHAHEQFGRLKQDGELTDGWQTFHLIGDSMRGDRALSPEFNRRLAARLEAEPTVLAPQRSAAPRRVMAYALSAAASVAAVALVGWVAFVSNPIATQQELAKAPVAPPVAAPAPELASVPSDGKMNDYLVAHQEFSPSTSIQGVAPYIRTVSSSQDKGR
ncbi:MAG TPA: sigma-E factor negative regulatory protein [Burkholderiales bacterium]|nr:sigma-E factor negative regulatory protein [Burkholderiales bacterium]